MRVLHVLDTIDPAGAGPVEAARLYCTATGPDHRPEVLSLDRDVERWRGSWPVPVHAVGRSRILPRYSGSLVPWLKNNRSRFDAVVVHCIWGYHLVGVWRALQHTLPYFLVLHGALNPWFRKAYPQKHLKKILCWWAVTGRAAGGAKAVFYLCPEEKRIIDTAFPIRSAGEAFVPLGTSPHESSPEPFFKRFPTLRGKRILLFFGRICYTKGCDLLLDAFAKVVQSTADAHLVMCGTDHEHWQATLIGRAERLGITERVTWTGPLFGDDRWPVLSAAELVVLPSRCDAFPIVVLEALSCRAPVLVTRDVNIHPQIERTGAGIVCDTTVSSVTSALANWLALGSTEREAFAERAVRCQIQEFDLHRAVQIHVEAIRKNLSTMERDATEPTPAIA